MNNSDIQFVQAVTDWRLDKSKQEIVGWWWEQYDVEDNEWFPIADAYVDDRPLENEYRRNITPLVKLRIEDNEENVLKEDSNKFKNILDEIKK